MMKEGALSVLVILIYSTLYSVYLEKLHRTPKIEGLFSLLPGQRRKGGTEESKGVELNCTASYQI